MSALEATCYRPLVRGAQRITYEGDSGPVSCFVAPTATGHVLAIERDGALVPATSQEADSILSALVEAAAEHGPAVYRPRPDRLVVIDRSSGDCELYEADAQSDTWDARAIADVFEDTFGYVTPSVHSLVVDRVAGIITEPGYPIFARDVQGDTVGFDLVVDFAAAVTGVIVVPTERHATSPHPAAAQLDEARAHIARRALDNGHRGRPTRVDVVRAPAYRVGVLDVVEGAIAG